MSDRYVLVQWNTHKRVYDAAIGLGVVLFILGFIAVSKLAPAQPNHPVGDEVLIIRATAACAVTMLHITLAIGPLARLWHGFAPLLYNRRHLGVATFLVSLAHALLATGYYGAFGGVLPITAVLSAGDMRSISGFPFEWFGLASLCLLLALAGTSHDFWLHTLSPRIWKRLHMSVYIAYAAAVLHVALGSLQSHDSHARASLLTLGALTLAGLHASAALRQRSRDRAAARAASDWLDVADTTTFVDGRAHTVRTPADTEIAVFRHGDAFCAIANTCTHQGGPLGEGQIIDGCVTCPWHGYQFDPHSGKSPPPFTDRVATYEVRIHGSIVQVRPYPKDKQP